MDINFKEADNTFLQKINSSTKIVAISNFDFSNEIEDYIKKYDCVIRFNCGANEMLLKKYQNTNSSISCDICVLSGFSKGFFGPIEGFRDKCILFSRPMKSENIYI
jgi:hypothetical protein